MDALSFGFSGYVLVPSPAEGFWRVSSWAEPLDPPPPPPALDAEAEEDDSGRYDDPEGMFRTLYCASEAEGAVGESLGEFVYSAAAAQRIEAYLLSEPDPDHDEIYQRPLTRGDIASFEWKLVHAPTEDRPQLIDVDDWRTYRAAAPRAVPALARYGVKRFDRQTVLDERRHVTRTMAGIWRRDATDEHAGGLRARGLRYTSRLPPAWECWALWEPLPLDADAAEIYEVTIDTPALGLAGDMLGVAIA